MKKVEIVLSPEAEEVFKYLNEESKTSKRARSIFNAIKKKSELIKANVFYGDPIKKRLFPKEYLKKYEIKNLFRIELPDYWRMIYSVEEGESEIEIISFVLDIINHKDYNKKFGYN